MEIQGWKGKTGACLDGGRQARALGSAAAVLDDDGHLLCGPVRVCEKTAGIYTLPPYSGWIEITGGDGPLLARLASDPTIFDCSTFEEDAMRLLQRVSGASAETGDSVAVFYPGPFRLIVLGDGTMLRRGELSRIDQRQAERLGRDVIAAPAALTGSARAPQRFQDLHGRHGSGILLWPDRASGISPTVPGTPERGSFDNPHRLSKALAGTSEELASRLAQLLDRGEPYFILTGSDPSDPHGCCPSRLVGEANALVSSGVLDAWKEDGPPEVCTVSFYAPAGEILKGDGPPQYNAIKERRDALAEALRRHVKRRAIPWKRILTGFLLGLFALSLGVSVHRCAKAWKGTMDQAAPVYGKASKLSIPVPQARPGADLALSRALGPLGNSNVLFVVFFHIGPACDTCRKMEALTKNLLALSFAAEMQGGGIRFASVDFGDPEHRAIGEYLGADLDTVGLIPIRGGKIESWNLLTEGVWRNLGNDAAFRDYLGRAIHAVLAR
ncbi:MAG: hypothetical protein J0L75_16075 [Spirochaetes bacterium]|nr:hypothetical protein [Spirochaetota bacterium]